MAVSYAIAAVGTITLMLFYATLKITKWSFNAGHLELGGQYITHLTELYRFALLVVVIVLFGRGIGSWLYDAFNFITHL